jgi:hypothetical protein
MIAIKTKDGIELNVECIHDPEEVDKILRNCFSTEGYETLKRQAIESEEVFIEFIGARRADLPIMRYHLVHLDRLTTDKNLTRGDWVITVHVHRDHIEHARKIVNTLRGKFKNANEWEETTNMAIESKKLFRLPRL